MTSKNILVLAFCFVSLLTACSSNTETTNLSISEFEKAISKNNIQLLDVRTNEEYQSGHLGNALLADWNNREEFKTRVAALDKNKPVYTYCLSGARSEMATEWLRENGFTAFNLAGGTNAWKRAGRQLEEAAIVRQITLAEYLVQIPTNETVLVDFSAVWCPPCKVMAPVIDSLVATHGTKFELVKIDGGQQTAICSELNVTAFPTFIMYRQGKEIWRKEGLVDAKEFIANF